MKLSGLAIYVPSCDYTDSAGQAEDTVSETDEFATMQQLSTTRSSLWWNWPSSRAVKVETLGKWKGPGGCDCDRALTSFNSVAEQRNRRFLFSPVELGFEEALGVERRRIQSLRYSCPTCPAT